MRKFFTLITAISLAEACLAQDTLTVEQIQGITNEVINNKNIARKKYVEPQKTGHDTIEVFIDTATAELKQIISDRNEQAIFVFNKGAVVQTQVAEKGKPTLIFYYWHDHPFASEQYNTSDASLLRIDVDEKIAGALLLRGKEYYEKFTANEKK